MGQINLITAVPLLTNTEHNAKTFYKSLANEQKEALLNSMKHAGNTDFYGAWLQTHPIGPWLIEYRSGDFNEKQLVDYFHSAQDPFCQYYLTQRQTFCGEHHKKVHSMRKIIDRDLRHIIPAGDYYGNILKIQTQNIGQVITFLDQIDRASPEQRTDYFKHTGLAYWQAWLQQYDGEHYIVQCHYMQGDFNHFRDRYEESHSPFARMIEKGCRQYFGMDLSNESNWQHVECLLSMSRGSNEQ